MAFLKHVTDITPKGMGRRNRVAVAFNDETNQYELIKFAGLHEDNGDDERVLIGDNAEMRRIIKDLEHLMLRAEVEIRQ